MLPLLRLLAPYVTWLYLIGAIILVVYLRAWFIAGRDLRASVFSLERESAIGRLRRAALGTLATLGCLGLLFFIQFYLGPSLDFGSLIQPTPTPEFMPKVAFVFTPTPPVTDNWTPEPIPTRHATPRPIVLETPTPTLTPIVITDTAQTETPAPTPTLPPPVACAPGVQISSPAQGARVQGRVDVLGTASVPDFQFYKIELGLGDHPTNWSSISDVHRIPVTNGVLDVWDTNSLPAGSYSLRLVVVDKTGNFAPPCVIQVTVAH